MKCNVILKFLKPVCCLLIESIHICFWIWWMFYVSVWRKPPMRNVGTRISLNNLNLKIHFRFELVSMVNCISNNGCRVKHHNVKSSLDNFILTMCVVLMRKNLSPVRDFIRVYMCVYTAVLLFFVFCFCVIKKLLLSSKLMSL